MGLFPAKFRLSFRQPEASGVWHSIKYSTTVQVLFKNLNSIQKIQAKDGKLILVLSPWFCQDLKPADSKGAKRYLDDTCKSSVDKDDTNINRHTYFNLTQGNVHSYSVPKAFLGCAWDGEHWCCSMCTKDGPGCCCSDNLAQIRRQTNTLLSYTYTLQIHRLQQSRTPRVCLGLSHFGSRPSVLALTLES